MILADSVATRLWLRPAHSASQDEGLTDHRIGFPPPNDGVEWIVFDTAWSIIMSGNVSRRRLERKYRVVRGTHNELKVKMAWDGRTCLDAIVETDMTGHPVGKPYEILHQTARDPGRPDRRVSSPAFGVRTMQ